MFPAISNKALKINVLIDDRLYRKLSVHAAERVEQPLLLVEDHVIVEVTSRAACRIPQGVRVVDFGDAILAPGFVDIHIHGGAGYDVMAADASGLSAVEQLLFITA